MEKSRIVVAVQESPIADPAPLGLAAFALTTFVLSAHNAGWCPDYVWITLSLFYGGAAQFAAGMWEYKRNNALGATAFTTYGSFWLALGVFVIFLHTSVIDATKFDVSEGLGYFLLAFFITNTFFLAVSTMSSKGVFLVFLLLELAFLFLFIGKYKKNLAGESWTKAGGYVGFFTAVQAWFVSFAVMFNHHAKKTVIPLGSPLLSFEPEAKAEDNEV